MNDNLAYFLIFIFATYPSLCKGESTREDQFRGSDRSLSEPNSDVAHSHRSNRALILPGALIAPNLEVNGTLWKSPTGARRDVNSTGESEGVMDRLFKMGEYLLDVVFNDDSDEEEDAPSASQEVQGMNCDYYYCRDMGKKSFKDTQDHHHILRLGCGIATHLSRKAVHVAPFHKLPQIFYPNFCS